MFSVAITPEFAPFKKLEIDEKAINVPLLIEGDKELDALCPVNHLTGSRENPLNLIGMILTDSKRHLLEKFLEEVPSSNEFRGLGDKEQLEFVCDYLSCGMPAEKDQLLSNFEKIADVAMPALREALIQRSKTSDQKIDFTPADDPGTKTE